MWFKTINNLLPDFRNPIDMIFVELLKIMVCFQINGRVKISVRYFLLELKFKNRQEQM